MGFCKFGCLVLFSCPFSPSYLPLSSYANQGGQRIFQVIQHLYLTRFGVYALAFRLTDLLSQDAKIRDEALEYLRFWLQSVSTHAVATPEQLLEAQVTDEDETRLAPMLLVGTHLDGVAGKTRAEKLANLQSVQALLEGTFKDVAAFACLKKDSLLRNAKDDLCFFPVDNTDDKDPNVELLRDRIVQCARQDQLKYGAWSGQQDLVMCASYC